MGMRKEAAMIRKEWRLLRGSIIRRMLAGSLLVSTIALSGEQESSTGAQYGKGPLSTEQIEELCCAIDYMHDQGGAGAESRCLYDMKNPKGSSPPSDADVNINFCVQ